MSTRIALALAAGALFGCRSDTLRVDGEEFLVTATEGRSVEPSVDAILFSDDFEGSEVGFTIPNELAEEREIDVTQLIALSLWVKDGELDLAGPIEEASGVLIRRHTPLERAWYAAEIEVTGFVEGSEVDVHVHFDVPYRF